MAFDAATREMYCPKCKESFEEGSRRFCPTDGTRLISDSIDKQSGQGVGIFASLISKKETDHTGDEVLDEAPRFVAAKPNMDYLQDEPSTDENDEPFFEIGDAETEFVNETDFMFAENDSAADSKPTARKINPNEIPAGHVDLEDSDRAMGIFADFNAGDPEGFVGHTVKGRYCVTEFLGGEETGLAYVAEDKIVVDKKVLVRIILDDESDEIMNSILAEERVALSHFSHPNIARLIDSGQFTDGTDFLISEFADALSARNILTIQGQFDELRAARVIRQAANALSEAHQEGILHRDLRPENLILSVSEGEAEQIKLVNFGASHGEPNAHNMAYKAPEVLDGRISTIASDIFSMAVVAYEILTGKTPFVGATAKGISRSQNAGLESLPSIVNPGLPAAIDPVLAKALSFNVGDRYLTAREFGDAFYTGLTESPQPAVVAEPLPKPGVIDEKVDATSALPLIPLGAASSKLESVKGVANTSDELPAVIANEPAWKSRSPEPPQIENLRVGLIAGVGLLVLLGLFAFGWYYVANHPSEPNIVGSPDQGVVQNNTGSMAPPVTSDIEVPPLPRKISQPLNTDYYQNSKQNLKGDLLRNFVGFTLYYPKDWKVNGPQVGATANARGKFLDISRVSPDGRMKEQMLISYYPSKGVFADDAANFPQMVKETNDTLRKILPGYQMVSEGEIKVNGDWRAYEVKFQGGGTSANGEKLVVWGRRLFIPAARPGVRNGFEITMLATSLADDVRSVDDVGVRGELAAILDSFEPSQNF